VNLCYANEKRKDERMVDGNNGNNASKTPFVQIDIASVVFPSMPDKVFRVNSEFADDTSLVIESKKTHEKWQCPIEDISKHGPTMEHGEYKYKYV
jgi:hypothetical protein